MYIIRLFVHATYIPIEPPQGVVGPGAQETVGNKFVIF